MQAPVPPCGDAHTRAEATGNPGAGRAYDPLPAPGPSPAPVCHPPGQREWARDDAGDGIREVHTNTLDGIWTGVRNCLRPFRGVSKWFLHQM